MQIPAKIPKLVQILGKGLVFQIDTNEPEVFLTFDDGPIEGLTSWILAQLDEYEAKATFFMVGENAQKRPDLVREIGEKGHSIGNHTHNHLSGFKTRISRYVENVNSCNAVLNSHLPDGKQLLFRPPYGRILLRQAYQLRKLGYQIIMWDVLSKDYDQSLDAQSVVSNVLQNAKPGSIIVMHDNLKAERNLKIALPQILEGLQSQGLRFSAL